MRTFEKQLSIRERSLNQHRLLKAGIVLVFALLTISGLIA